jgi:excisionase family DNA binding protein
LHSARCTTSERPGGIALDEHIRAIVRDELHASATDGVDEWVDQNSSPLKRKKYLELVRKGELRESKCGRQVLVRRSELDVYLEAHPSTTTTEPDGPANGEEHMDAQFAKLGFVE